MHHISKKQHQTEVLRKSTQPKNKHDHHHAPRDVIDEGLRQQLRKRQHVIQRIYKKSVTNKLYIFPRQPEDIENISLGSYQSIEEMNEVERYKLASQNHQSNATVKNNVNYFSQSVVSSDHEDSRAKIDLRKFRTKFSSNKKLIDSASVEKIVYSGRVAPQKMMFKGSMSKKKEESNGSSLNKEMKPRNHTSIYEEILKKVGLKIEKQARDKSNSTNNAMKKSHFTYRKTKNENTSQDSLKDRYKRFHDNEPAHNISVSKILEKYKSSSRKKEERCKTEHY